jgi:hypothetical protein
VKNGPARQGPLNDIEFVEIFAPCLFLFHYRETSSEFYFALKVINSVAVVMIIFGKRMMFIYALSVLFVHSFHSFTTKIRQSISLTQTIDFELRALSVLVVTT